MSPFKVGQIQKLISDINEQAGTVVAPFFIVLQVLFLLAFVGYLVVAIVALCLDWEAMGCDCAEDSWIWLYVLLALAIPTTFGFIMGLVKAGLALADLKNNVGWEIRQGNQFETCRFLKLLLHLFTIQQSDFKKLMVLQ